MLLMSLFVRFILEVVEKMGEEKKKCGLYMRVSTDEQARERF